MARIEKRPEGKLLIVFESEAESALVDEVLGKTVDNDGLIAKVVGELRLTTDLSAHYITLQQKRVPDRC